MEWLSAQEAAERLGVSRRQVLRLVTDDELPARRVGSMWLVPDEAVRERIRMKPSAGRPLSPTMAWSILLTIEHLVSADGDNVTAAEFEDVLREVSPDARTRRRIRALLAAAPPPERWAAWLRRRANAHRLWVHPGELDRLRKDHRLHAAGAAAAAAAGLSGAHGNDDYFYVHASNYPEVLADYRAQQADDGQVVALVVPAEVESDIVGQLGAPVPAAVSLVDCLSSSDAREAHLAHEHLGASAKILAAVVHR